MRVLRFFIVLGLLSGPAAALDCETVSYEDATYTICRVDAGKQDIRLFLNDPEDGKTLGTFGKVDQLLEKSGKELAFAMNAGMYHPDRRPVGHYGED